MKNFTKTAFFCITMFMSFAAKAVCTINASYSQIDNSITVTSTSTGSIMIANYSVNWGDGTPFSNEQNTLLNQTHTYAANGNYSIVITFTDFIDPSCLATQTIPVTISSITSLCNAIATASGNTLSTATPGASFQWITCPNNIPIALATTNTYIAPGSGNYAVIVTNANGCIDTSNCLNLVAVCNVVTNITISGSTATITGSGTGSIMIPQFRIIWGDGTPNTSVSGSTLPATAHTYTAAGSYNVCVVFEDLLGGSGCFAQQCTPIVIGAATCIATATSVGNIISTANIGVSYSWINCATNTLISGATVTSYTPAVSGSYAVIVTTSTGCIDTSNCVQVTIPVTCVATATLAGNTISTTNAGVTYKWINCTTNTLISGATATSYTPAVSGSYAVIVTTSTGCIDTSNCVQVTIPVSCIATATLAGNTISTANVGVSFKWINCTTNTVIAGATTNSYIPTITGSYAVIVTTSTGCVDTSNCVLRTVSGASLNENVTSIVVAYPNPATDEFTIEGVKIENATMSIFNTAGQELKRASISTNSITVSDLPKGVYFVNILQNGIEHKIRLIKE